MNEDNIKDLEIANRIKRVFDFLYDNIKEYGELSMFKEDVMIIINELLLRVDKSNLTATAIVANQQNFRIQQEKESCLKKQINELQEKIEYLKKEYLAEQKAEMQNTIPKSKIKEKIKIRKEEKSNCTDSNEAKLILREIYVLQELLGEE